ncbi:response regulator [Roseateles sp.]|uniref:Hpt domain-containing response regulator n=1 Tax=Roseateles sp. TaxID=1971397 RepID=UPI0039EA7033
MTGCASPPRLLLVEDDSSLQRFVAMALEDAGIELVTASSVDEGLEQLRSGPFFLVITDLMLPIRSGFELIDTLAAESQLLGSARLAVFSAGLNPETRQRLSRPEVWRLLPKPCSVAELLGCVHDAQAHTSPLQAATDSAPAAEQTAIARYFGGNTSLYRAFHDSCLQQFPADIATGERAFAAGDLVALRHLAHSLKSVLLTLGRDDDSALAKSLEDACANGDAHQASLLWPTLGHRLGVPK